MRFLSLKTHGIKPFTQDVNLDLASLPGRIVAVHGANGAGKSTLMEMLCVGPYRGTPTHGDLKSLASTRDSYVEVVVENGSQYTIRHGVDCISGKSETLVTNGSSRPVLDDGKVSTFDKWAKAKFVPQEVYFAGPFAAQLSGGLLAMTSSERMSVVLRALGIERYEAMARTAREKAAIAKAKHSTLLARIADEQDRGMSADEVKAELSGLMLAVECATSLCVQARVDFEQGQAELQVRDEALRQIEEHRQQMTAIEGRERQAKTKLLDIGARIQNNEKLLEQGDAVRVAVVRDAELAEELRQLATVAEQVRRELDSAKRNVFEHTHRRQDAAERSIAARKRMAAAQARLADREAIERAQSQIAGLQEAVDVAQAQSQVEEDELERLRGQRVAGAEDRIIGLRGGLQRILDNDGFRSNVETADATLRHDDKAVQLATELPSLLQSQQEVVKQRRQALHDAMAQLSKAERTSARAGELEQAESELHSAMADEREADKEAEREHVALRQYDAEVHKLMLVQTSNCAQTAERKALAPLLALVDKLTGAEARLSELIGQREDIESELFSLAGESAALGEPPPEPPLVRHATSQDVIGHESALQKAHAAVAVAEHRLELALERQAKLDELAKQRAATEDDVADWTLLAESLGREGIQAAEVDAATPELTALTNDLLHSCCGPRWTTTWQTTRLDSKGKKEIEECNIRVLDTNGGGDRDGKLYSPGQRAIVELACSLALTMYSCRKLGIERPTIIRDESSSGLDAANSIAYVAMLRKAAEIVDAPQVLFISHNDDMVALADARIHVCDGKVEVEA